MSLYKTHGDRLETTEKRSQVLIFTFSGIEWHVEQRKLQERILVDVLSEFRCAIQTEKPTRNDVCGRLFRLSGGQFRQRNLPEVIFVVVRFGF